MLSLSVGCSTPHLTQQLYREKTADSVTSASIANVPFFPQQRFQCGPAALATVFNYRGLNITPDELKDEVYLPKREGSLQVELTAATRKRGLIAYPLAPSLIDLFKEIDGGNPVLVLQNLGIQLIPKWHYAVVAGYDMEESTITLRSGTTQNLTMPISTFEHTWERGSYWGLVILPPSQLPETAEPLKYLKAAQSLEAIAQFGTAQSAYEAALKRWPNNRIALLGLGNAHYALARYDEAGKAFKQLTSKFPYEPEGWNNLAYAMLAQYCKDAAILAAQCTVTLSNGSPQYMATLQEIRSASLTSTPAGHCEPVVCPVRE
ncbi:PA2778 family cysteine peptidase [Alkalimarinus coralli]|uniref:PA2778 family cysteine peptidase n=1 Tax=Alkalimarinus coralli TaxID=2935863 RepID=UPI00202AF85C|nr:PA2778 family cysteine peptidase [Alkalimarinus coralli]